ncbi:MAG: dihydrolipoyl dehydrogenase [Candidatus Omnitrophota bacterium]
MYDLSIIGSGWAGLNAAIRANKSGLKVCLIERAHIGGACLNLGCIPTKTLIHSAKVYALARKSQKFGLEAAEPKINFIKVQERKDAVIRQLRQGAQGMLKGVDFLNTEARILSNQEIEADGRIIKTKNIIIATGSKPAELAAVQFNSKDIVSSDDILNIKEIPDSLLIIGGGVIGCEFASLFSCLGAQVTIAEKMPQLLPQEDTEIARKIESIFKKRGIRVNTNTDVAGINLEDYALKLVCVGRVPETEGLGLEKIGVSLDKGRIVVNEYLKTSVDNIYAAGDNTGKLCLAHFAAYQGKIAAENIIDPDNLKSADNINIPSCIFCDPEIASVGLNEQEARRRAVDIKINKFDFMGSSMARILDETEGFIKIISHSKTQEVLGASIIGPRATELIAVLALAVSSRLKISGIRDTIFAHPTLSESIQEALK